jgi:spore maturation protein CgeB
MKKVLFLLEDYNYFYTRGAEAASKNGAKLSYDETLKDLLDKKHYQSDGLSSAFREMGFSTQIVIPEANPLQLKWAKENRLSIYLRWLLERPVRSYKSRRLKRHRTSYNSIQYKVLLAQVRLFKPDIIYFYSNIFVTKEQIRELQKYSQKVVLQWTCPIWPVEMQFPYEAFDMIITAAPQLKEYFNSKKYPTVYIPQAFDDRILNELPKKADHKKGDVVFIGSFSLGHNYRFEVLEFLLKNNIDLTIYGTGEENLPENSLVRKNMKPPLYGLDMYREYMNYRMGIHIHTTGINDDGIDWNKFSGAKRIFEITGVGTLLLTPLQDNIKDFFEIGKEVVTFTTASDLLTKIHQLVADPASCAKIAERGKIRTLKDHTFKNRATQLAEALSILQ